MAKPRVYEIAKDLNLASKEVIEKLNDFGVKVKNHMSTLANKDINLLLDYYTQESEKKHKAKKETTIKNKKPQEDNNRKKTENKDDKKTPKKKHYDIRQNVVNIEKYENNEKIEELIDEDLLEDNKGKKPKAKKPKSKKKVEKEKKVEKKEVKITQDEIAVGEFAEIIKKPQNDIIKQLINLGVMASVNQNIDFDTASIVADELGVNLVKEMVQTQEDIYLKDEQDLPEKLQDRSPVVVVLGHVDHGKTSLLDAIRESNVSANEAGGITQHIGAYRVKVHDKEITFLDTPGHEAFTAMRARGAQVTDIAILVVAADDGIMPQTVEAINHAKAANVKIIVAINKIDKAGANPERVKQQLVEHDLVPEDWGGDTICVPVSAIKKEGINNLLEMVILVAEMQELKANPDRKARGAVIESELDKGRGPVATVLVQKGTLNVGDIIIAGTAMGKIRAMFNDKGQKVKNAGPSIPVEILGLSEVPSAGDDFYVVEDEKIAKNIVSYRKEQIKENQLKTKQKVSLDNLFDQIKVGEVKELNIILKADVQGSVEAVKQSLEKLSNEEVRVNVIHCGVGTVNESDVMLALASDAIIVGFNVRPDSAARLSAETHDIDIRLYRVIYHAVEEMQSAMKGMLEPKYKEVINGHAEIRATFKVSGIGTIAGCYVTDGKITRNSNVRIIRDGVVVHEGDISSLKRFKDDAKEVASGYECGIGIEKFNDIKVNDVIEAYEMKEIKE